MHSFQPLHAGCKPTSAPGPRAGRNFPRGRGREWANGRGQAPIKAAPDLAQGASPRFSAASAMWVRFAPLRLPVRRRLQTAAVLQWVFSFLALAQCCLGLFALLLLGEGWALAALYAAWLYLDWDTPARGGRRSAWLVKVADLDPKRNYVFGFHPHGVLVAGAFGNFCTEATGFRQLFPGLTPHLLMLPFWFKVPFFRDYIMSGGLVSSEKASASYLLSREGGGQVAVVAVGGPPESLEARPGAFTLQIQNRKGFIKMALQHGAALVPVFSFGENELFNQVSNPEGSFLRTLQERLQKAMGLALPLFHARGVFQYSFGLLPFRRPIHTVVGAPILMPKTPNPSLEAIDQWHKTYLEKLVQLFEVHKVQFGVPEDKHLNLI
ncbi:2-acylglycerol O-acyltransferase 2-A-like isoform X2 [Paroedura picta]|uniref:2-acylglycerol O-acyltransferase 2-A-like isoform X2 n=1 Tax=Paroedura picta TaxID=143630 RepID=UPI004055C5DC